MIERRLIGSALLCLFFLGGMAQEQRYNGYPSREGNIDIKENFADPPKGYGNIPFYWWNGDSLNRERLQEQLQILSEASTDGFSVSYIHSHPLVDVKLNSNGYGGFGKADLEPQGFLLIDGGRLGIGFPVNALMREWD